jgi:hypothetical protein
VLKLGLPLALRRFFATTRCIENLIGMLRHVTRNIKRWRDGDMRRRWLGLGLLRAAELEDPAFPEEPSRLRCEPSKLSPPTESRRYGPPESVGALQYRAWTRARS